MAIPTRRSSLMTPPREDPPTAGVPAIGARASEPRTPPGAAPAPVRPAAPGAGRPRSSFSAPAPTRVRAPPPPDPSLPPFGREKWPPAPGSGYFAFLEWAADGGWATEEDTDLAIGLFMGTPPHPGTGPEGDGEEPVARGPGI